MTHLPLPALDGRTPLGFLAGLGILRLLRDGPAQRARLAWSPQDRTAILVDAHDTVDALVADLETIVDSIPEAGVLPDLPTDFPPLGAAPDKLRLPRPALRAYAETIWRDTGTIGERWLASLVTDLSLDQNGRADISLFTAPSGKQSMRTMLEKPLMAVRRHPETLREAVMGWRRYDGVTGEYLDHHVLFDAADAGDGKSQERGVPGATWLALMSYPLFRTTVAGSRPVSTCWRRPPGRGEARLVYPLWSEPLDPRTVVALLDHPAIGGAEPGPAPAPIRLLSVFWICHAHRQRIPGRTFAGVLTPIQPHHQVGGRRR